MAARPRWGAWHGPAMIALTSGQRVAFGTAAVFAAVGLIAALTLLGKRSDRSRSAVDDRLVSA